MASVSSHGRNEVYLVEKQGELDWASRQEIHQRRQRIQLARLLQITEKMLGHAQQGEWQTVEELEALRKTELDTCYDLQQQSPSLLVAEALATLLYLNDQIVELVKVARSNLMQEHGQFAKVRQTVNRYQEQMP